MNKTLTILTTLFIALIFSSCGVTKQKGEFHEKKVLNQGLIATDYFHADMEIDDQTKINGEATATYFLFFRVSGDNNYADVRGPEFELTNPFSKTVNVKKAAQYDALTTSNSDFVAKPSYTITKRTYMLGLFTQVDVKVSGYGGVYKNFQQIDPWERDLENAVNKKLVDKLRIAK